MSAIDRIKKKRELLEIEKSGGSQLDVSKKRIEQHRNELSTTGKIDYGPQSIIPKMERISPVKTSSTKEKEELSPTKSFSISYNEDYEGSEEAKTASKFRDFRTVKDVDARMSELSSLIAQEKKKSSKGLWDEDKNIGQNLYRLFLDPKGGSGDYEDNENIKKYQEELTELAKHRENMLYNKASSNMSTSDKFGYTMSGNLDTARQGIESTFAKILGQTPDSTPTLNERLASAASEQSSGIEKVGLDVVGSTFRMLPNMLVGGVAGAAGLGAKVAGAVSTAAGFANYGGGAYNQAKQEGYTEEQATKYGITIGTMEMALTKALGSMSSVYGTSKLGGMTQKAVDGAMSKVIGNTFVRNTLTSFASEGTEEFLQEYIDNIARDTLLDEKGFLKSTWENITDTQVLEDALYSAMIGGIVGSSMDLGRNVDIARQEKEVIKTVETEIGRKLTSEEKRNITKELETIRKTQESKQNNAQTGTQSRQQTTTTTGPQTVEEIDNQIATLESQLNSNLSDTEYEKITNQIRELEEQAEQLEQNGPITTQEVETNSLVEPSSNTLDTGSNVVQDANTMYNASNTQQDAQMQETLVESEQQLVNKTFAEQVDEAIQGKYPKRDMLVVSEKTPKILQDIGLNDLPITMTQKHLYTMTNKSGKYKNVNYHNIDPEIIKQIPEAISRPLDVLKSDTKDDSIVVVTELADGNNDIIVASIKIDGQGQINDIQIDSNVMTSAYGKSGNYDYFMKDNIEKGNLLYDIDEGIVNTIKKDTKKESDTTDRFQLPMRGSSSKTTSDIPKNISPITTNNITSNEKNVKFQIKKGQAEWTKTPEGITKHFKDLQKSLNEGLKPGDRHYQTDEEVQEVIDSSIEMLNKDLAKQQTTSKIQEDLSPINKAVEDLKQAQKEVIEQVEDLKETMDEFKALTKEQYQGLQTQLDEANSQEQTPPPEVEVYNDKLDTSALDDRTVNKITKDFARGMKLNKTQKAELNSAIKEISSRGNATTEDVLDILYNYDEMSVRQRNEEIAEAKGDLKNINSLKINSTIANDVDMPKLRQLAKNNLKFKVDNMGNVDMYYEELSNKYPHLFPSDVITPSQQFEIMVDIASTPIYSYESLKVPHGTLIEEAQYMYDLMEDFKIDQKTKDADKDYKEWVKSLRKVEAPQEMVEDVAPSPVKEEISKEAFNKKIEELSGEIKNELGYIPKDPTKAESYEYDEEIAEVLDTEPKTDKQKKNRLGAILKANILDKGIVFEDLSIKTKNRELQGKWDYTLTSESRAQYVIGNGHIDENGNQISKSLNDIMAEVNNTGLTKEFYDYIYHKHNVDRMNLSTRFEGMEDKPVFGYSVTSEVSQQKVNEYEMTHPEFMDFAQDVYDYVNADRAQLVKEGVISQETADLWQQMYPHYVPIRRAGHEGPAINVALDTNRTGINAPIKKATGGNSDILPLFDTMAQRTIQTQRATAKNSFGIELKNTLKAKSIKNTTSVDEIIDSVDNQEGLLQEGKNGANPTFTVFQNGERVTYEITEEMYEALKPISDSSILSKTFKPTHIASNIHRGLLTQYNIFFALKNGVKDIQDVLINSQHAAKTYTKIPEAYAQLIGKGHWYNEYMRNGGEQNSYFDSQEMNFDTKHKGVAKVLDWFPLKQVAQLNDFIERVPRLAEYIASRESGRSIEVSMLDAARVTTNFKAGGNLTKFANRNGATFLNASVQGALQQVRNVREANMNGFKGWANLATKFAMAGLPAMLLNGLLWDDDEEYEELSDYVKQNYYIVGKYGDGQFIRIPKGRTVAVIQDGIEQISNVATGNDEADLASFLELVTTNLAPTNPLENNIFAPIIQATTNKTWYGDDLVPSRLADLPEEEQFDETTDSFSRWLGEKTGVSPVKINYLLNQYSGVVGDVVMPMITPKATQESGSPLLAPLKDIFTVDGVMKNQNVSDFYETSEKLTTGAKASGATDEDILKNKYINSVKTKLNDLYKEKREIQSNETLSKGDKYKQAKEIQKQINEITKDALSKYSDGQYTDDYGIIDDKEYYKNKKGDWTAVNGKEQTALNEMSLSLEEKSSYFKTVQTLNDIEEKYKGEGSDYSLDKKREVIETIQNTGLSEDAQARLYKKQYNTDDVDRVLITGIGLNNYFDYVQQDIKADKNKKGNAISGSRKNKVINYVNEYDLNIAQKAILIKSTNTFKFNDYNYDIVEYVGGLDIDYEDKIKILEDLDFKVYDNGTVEWE